VDRQSEGEFVEVMTKTSFEEERSVFFDVRGWKREGKGGVWLSPPLRKEDLK
jgi:cytochrome oxidase assembly protein ShyY1